MGDLVKSISIIKREEVPISKNESCKELLFSQFAWLTKPGNEGKALKIDLRRLGLSYQGLRYIIHQWTHPKPPQGLSKIVFSSAVEGSRALKYTVRNARTHPIVYVYRPKKARFTDRKETHQKTARPKGSLEEIEDFLL